MLDKLEKDDLWPTLIKQHACHIGVEVGVRDGSHARHLLETTDMILCGVDIVKYPGPQELVAKYMPRFTMIYNYSVDAATMFFDGLFSWIYIDADHRYESVRADLHAWWPKLHVGGIFCGDDFCNCLNPAEGQYGIVQAVEEFIADKNVELHISGIGVVDKQTRLDYANMIGKLHEDNFTGRKRTEGVPVPQWWFIKCQS